MIRINKRWWCTGILALSLLLMRFSAPGQQGGDFGPMVSITDPKFLEYSVASVGSLSILAQEFMLNYEFGPGFPKRRPDSRHTFLKYLINEKLLAQDGYARGLDKTPAVVRTLAEIEGDLATEELYKDDILKHIRLTQEEVEAGMRKQRITLSLQWVFEPVRERIERAYRLIRADSTAFDSLYTAQFCDTVSTDDRSMVVTRFVLEGRNPAMAAMVDSLDGRRFSAPIRTPDGYYIVRLVASSVTPLVAETDLAKTEDDVRRALMKRKADQASDEYVQKTMMERMPQIERRAFDQLMAVVARRWVPASCWNEWGMERDLEKKWGTVDTGFAGTHADETLVTMKDGYCTVGDFMNWYELREANLKFRTTSPRDFFSSFQQFVWRMVRDRLLVERAMKRGLATRTAVRFQRQWWQDKLVYRARREELLADISLADSLVQAYYREHRVQYRDSTGAVRPFSAVRDDVLREYDRYETDKRLLHRIQALREKFPVRIDEAALKQLPLESENDPRAIDVYAVKKGGIYPRPAYPSIDYEWQSWE